MPSLDATFDELRQRLQSPEALNPAKSDPVFYFVHAPHQTLELRTKLPLWSAMLRQDGKEVATLSLADLVWNLIDASGRWHDWLEVEPEAELMQINEAVRDVLRAETGLVETVAEYVAQPIPDRVLFLTDAGLVHPYFRLRSLESGLHDRVHVPTVVFYPGRRSGQYGLHFLGFYSVDGNYRSTLLGGQP
jgi:bacteriophage exclusion system BrxB-like protein